MVLDVMASSRVDKLERSSGLHSTNKPVEKGVVQGQLRRQLSTVNLRASMACLLDRMHQCGEGGRMRGKRQEWMMVVEERMRREREAQWVARVRGKTLLRKGHIFHG